MMQSKHTISFRVTDDEKHLIQSYAASHHLIVSSFIRDLVLDQLEEDGELEEARFLKALELSYKEVYDLEEMLYKRISGAICLCFPENSYFR